ncbi:glutathione S-transferase [Paludibacterium purpuratum]|uniref:Glutathione S-transferase n=2 Tax=Paludibacterium purpuratum TaxID=1144873 RepID=A0A4R7BD26_9NEIS|nr:glutathione S-transferase [Paludibacterium purpuratum]
MMMNLIQFPYSHFCEKARWALDYKGQSYARENLLPGLHLLRTKRLAPRGTVPILQHDQQVIQGSDAIIDYLDAHWPQHPLTPQDPDLARQADEWEQYAAREIGVPLRRWFYSQALGDRRRALMFLQVDATPLQRAVLQTAYPLLRLLMKKGMNINPATGEASRLRLEAALDRLDASLAGRAFLVGDQFSRADLTVCALLAPLVAIGKSEAELADALTPVLLAWRQTQSVRPCFDWVRGIYRDYRRK